MLENNNKINKEAELQLDAMAPVYEIENYKKPYFLCPQCGQKSVIAKHSDAIIAIFVDPPLPEGIDFICTNPECGYSHYVPPKIINYDRQ